jgi:hypothetical protein
MLILTILYTLFAIFSYIWTLGGFKFHVFATEEDISVEVEGKYPIWMPIAFIAVMGVLLILLPLVKSIIEVAKLPKGFGGIFKIWLQLFKMHILSLNRWRFLFSAVYSAAVLAPFPKKKIEE